VLSSTFAMIYFKYLDASIELKFKYKLIILFSKIVILLPLDDIKLNPSAKVL